MVSRAYKVLLSDIKIREITPFIRSCNAVSTYCKIELLEQIETNDNTVNHIEL